MKKLSKIVALLLAGALTMLLFTACGGGGGSNLTAQKDEEEKVVSLIGKKQNNVAVVNDGDLRAVAEGHLREDLNGGFQFGNHKFIANVHVDGEKQDYLIVTVTANYTYNETLLSSILKAITDSDKVPNEFKGSLNQSGGWSKVGVAVLSNTEQSYIGVSIRIDNPKK